MMSRDSICGRAAFRSIGPLRTFMACVLLSVSSIGAAAQGAGDPPALAPGLHELTLARAGEPAVGYAISIPPTYSPSTPAPLILALHFGIDINDFAFELRFTAAGQFGLNNHRLVTYVPRVVLILVQKAIDAQTVHPHQAQYRVAGLHPFADVRIDGLHDAFDGAPHFATFDGGIGVINFGLLAIGRETIELSFLR